ncbi:UNVERIFIED_CONTAM: hypothetical protein Slati_3448100 [Sesamum latifolium]|uniref:RNase H type-1 domain-containing protein n=1 Tax=Sesamum latifolium TaxID=2727402 RepID=A0AAW2UII6_9LAMI
MAVDIKQLHLKVYGDSQLVVNQLLGLYEVKRPELLPYHNYTKRLMGWLEDVELEHLQRRDNKQADALAKLTSTLSVTDKEARIPISKSWVIPPIFSDDEDYTLQEEENHVMEVFQVKEEDWRQPLINCLKCGKLPNDPRRWTDTRWQTIPFIYYKGTLYRRSFDGIFLRCLSDDEKSTEEVVAKSKRDRYERIGEALWAYRTTIRTPTQSTPYALVYGVEAVLPLEQQIPSLRMAIQEGLTEEENARIRLEELEALDEKRLEAQ